MRRQLAALLVFAFTLPQAATGQAITSGSRVRVSHPGEGTRIGTVVELSADTLEVRFADRSDPAHMALEQVTRLDVSRGKQRRVLHRAGMGFLVGAGVGAVWGGASEAACEPGNGELCFGVGGGAILGGVFLGAVGGLVGLVAGISPAEKWERVPLERRRIGIVAPTRNHGPGLGLSVAF